jgi:membrane protease YdiL (CAAX protease family)
MTTVSSVAAGRQSGFKTLVQCYPVVSMSILTLIFAWPGLIWEALYSRGLVASQSPLILSLLIGWVPGISAVVVSAIIAGRAGVLDLLRRFLIWRVGVVWYVVALFMLAGFILGGIGLHVSFGGAMPVIPAVDAPILTILLSFFVTILFASLINTEEIAWRGFALPRLQARYGVLAACILLAIPESLLHLPYFWNKDVAFYQTVGMFWFTTFSLALVFIYAFLFNKTKGSLLIVTIAHASQNAWANLLSDNTLRPFQFTVALVWMVAIALIFLTKGQLGYEAEQK